MLENHIFSNDVISLPRPHETENCILVDWLTFVIHGSNVDYVKWLLGLDDSSIPWQELNKFRNGYPCSIYFNGITISYGADDPKFYDDPTKARTDMGICVNLSGTGCRCFETHGYNDWLRLFSFLTNNFDFIAAEYHKYLSVNITRLDLAYDDHFGILDIYVIEDHVRERLYISKSKYSEITWSDNINDDIHGLNIQIGSNKSDIKIRIYDKAAERGFKDRHWIRVEMQLRDDRAFSCVKEICSSRHIGNTYRAILANYLSFRDYIADSNKSRWPVCVWWDRILLDLNRIRLWVSPGEPYNFSRTEYFLTKQYGASIVVLSQLGRLDEFIQHCHDTNSLDDLAPKYKSILYGDQL